MAEPTTTLAATPAAPAVWGEPTPPPPGCRLARDHDGELWRRIGPDLWEAADGSRWPLRMSSRALACSWGPMTDVTGEVPGA